MSLRFRSGIGCAALWLLATGTAHAQCSQDAGVQKLLGMTPIGPYAQSVVTFVQDGINEAEGGGGELPDSTFFDWWRTKTNPVRALVNNGSHYAHDRVSLQEESACLLVDHRILEAWEEEVTCILGKSFEAGNTGDVNLLAELLGTLDSKIVDLLRGANDPLYADAEGQCPFASDYLPPTAAGYGCSVTALAKLRAYEPIEAEFQALTDLQSQIEAFRESLEVPAVETPEPPPVSGCLNAVAQQLGLDPAVSVNDSLWTEGMTSRSRRGVFRLALNQFSIGRAFVTLRTGLGGRRPLPDFILNAADSISGRILGRRYADEIRTFSRLQEQEFAATFARSVDSPFTIANGFSLDRGPFLRLMELSSSLTEGPRKFARDLAWYLRRSCIYRPCNDKLDLVLKRLYSDACFPYTRRDGSVDPNDCPKPAATP